MIRMNRGLQNETPTKAFKDFMIYNKARNLADRTLDYYQEKLKRFLNWLEETEVELKDINEKKISQYIIYLESEFDIADTTVNAHLRAVRAFIYYCQKFEYVKEFKVQLIKTRKKVKETYKNPEIKVLLKKPNTRSCSFAIFRNWVIVNFLLGTGVRLSTLVNLRIGDLDFDNQLINLSHTKNRKAQIIPMSRTLFEVLQEYLLYRKGDKEGYLFCSQQTGKKLTTGGMQMAIKDYHLRRGVSTHSIHKYRHTFAKISIQNGVDAFTLMKLLGHSSISVTKEYVHLFSDDLKQKFNDYCPLEQFSSSGKESIKMR